MIGTPTAYRVGRFIIDLQRGALLADGIERSLRPKFFALLRHLAEHAGRPVGRDEIMQAVWPGTFVTEDSITQCIRDIRRALGDEAAHLLRTLPRRGYLLASAEPAAPEPARDGRVVRDLRCQHRRPGGPGRSCCRWRPSAATPNRAISPKGCAPT